MSSKDDPIPPSSCTVVCSLSIRAVLLAHALALPDEVDQRIRQDVIDDNDVEEEGRSLFVFISDMGEYQTNKWTSCRCIVSLSYI